MPRHFPIFFVVACLLFATSAQAITPADKCEADKNKIAGKFASCRANAVAKGVKKGLSPDFSKCDVKFLDKMAAADAKAIAKGGVCPSTDDTVAVDVMIRRAMATLAAEQSVGMTTCGPDSGFLDGNCIFSSETGESCIDACIRVGLTHDQTGLNQISASVQSCDSAHAALTGEFPGYLHLDCGATFGSEGLGCLTVEMNGSGSYRCNSPFAPVASESNPNISRLCTCM